MSDTHVAPGGGADAVESVPAVNPASNTESFSLDPREAARQLSNHRWKRDNPEAAKAEEAKAEPQSAPEQVAAAEPPEESEAQAEDAAPQEIEAPGETTETDPAVEEQPSVEPPRSWTKDAKDAFKLLPPALQKDVAELERSREVETRRGQNEVAEKLKAMSAKEQAAEQLRQQYEAALPQLQQAIQEAKAGEFADIKTQADVERLANEDWPRFARWQAHQMKVDAVEREARAAQERQASQFKSQWAEYSSKEDAKAAEKIPDLADKAKASKIADAAMSTLESVGFSRDEFAKAWLGEAAISPRDHRWQQIVWKAAQYDMAKANVKPAPKPVPPVQRPGVSKAPTSAADAEVQTLQKAFERTPSAKNAAALLNAKRRVA